MLPQEIIVTKRDGGELPAADIRAFVEGLTSGAVSEGQAAAFAMAVFFRGMSRAERVALTEAMRDSGTVLRWGLPGPVVDKHSTGGVGDNVSLMLAPALAACGAFVPMISGRGLGHTGGTLDKLAAIPGYDVAPDAEEFARVVRETGCAIIGQTDDIAPADRRLYAIRDVTGTVESHDLIIASILSKKLAAGLDALVLDVKAGSGAFMATQAQARELARGLVSVAGGAGCRASALITDMNQPLAACAGNAIETINAIRFLRGDSIDPRLWEATLALGGEALALAGLAADAGEGSARVRAAFEDGRAAEIFGRMVAALGGPADIMENFAAHLPLAPVVLDVFAEAPGFVQAVDARALGMAVVELGGGRRRPQDAIDFGVGLTDLAWLGAVADEDWPLARVRARSPEAAEAAAARVRAAYEVRDAPPPAEGPVVLGRVGPEEG